MSTGALARWVHEALDKGGTGVTTEPTTALPRCFYPLAHPAETKQMQALG